MKHKSKRQIIEEFIIGYLREHGPSKRTTLIAQGQAKFPSEKRKNIDWSVSQLSIANKILRLERGVWGLPSDTTDISSPVLTKKIYIDKGKEKGEEKVYEPFARWLELEEECTRAMPFGGGKRKSPWTNPDVIGAIKVPKMSWYRGDEIVSFVSAEVKEETNALEIMKGFGQACAYLRFSHRVYLVLPTTVDDYDQAKIEALCSIVGLGLVYYDPKKLDDGDFEIRQRPKSSEPEVRALNEFLAELQKGGELAKLLEEKAGSPKRRKRT